ncbi:hypothetical protein TM7_0584 [candidate division TM7 genomosp. GTL1]|nr:hypothetical protein TM7_0584 [candidate division TM7 genomosp. GTL1]
MLKRSLRLFLKRTTVFFVIASVAVSAVPFAPAAAQGADRFSWARSGNMAVINVTQLDGRKAEGQLHPSKQDPQNTFVGSFHSTNDKLFGSEDCYSNLYVRLTGNNSALVIQQPAGEPGGTFPTTTGCNNFPGFGTTISISGTRPVIPETSDQQGIRVRVFGDPQGKRIIVHFKSTINGSTGEYAADKQGDGFYYVDLVSGPDTYTVSCGAGLPFDCGTVTVEKKKYVPLTIDLGESAQSKEADFYLYIDCSVVKESPQFQLGIYDNRNRLATTLTTRSVVVNAFRKDPPIVKNATCLLELEAGPAKDLKPGDYTACIVGRKYCTDFTKVFAQRGNIILLFGFDDIPDDDIVCVAGMLGWLFCPLAELARNISETVAGTVEGLLYVEPLTLSTNSPIYITWTLVRDIANITLVILFLIIIFSQATSRGISNYGIKRILPRLIIMAVLINISYYVCAFAIDIANLIGAGVKGFIQVGLDAAPKPNLGEDEWDGSYKGLIVGLFVAHYEL